MSEGFIHPQDAPATRGRRDRELQARMQDQDMLASPEEGDQAEETMIGLYPGDIVMAKATHAFTRDDGGDSWFSYGVQTRVGVDESEEQAYIRAATVVNERILDMADDAEERIRQVAAASRARRR